MNGYCNVCFGFCFVWTFLLQDIFKTIHRFQGRFGAFYHFAACVYDTWTKTKVQINEHKRMLTVTSIVSAMTMYRTLSLGVGWNIGRSFNPHEDKWNRKKNHKNQRCNRMQKKSKQHRILCVMDGVNVFMPNLFLIIFDFLLVCYFLMRSLSRAHALCQHINYNVQCTMLRAWL